MSDPASPLQASDPGAGDGPVITLARADGRVWIDLAADLERVRILRELFNAALGRDPGSTKSLIDQTTATPRITKVKDAAARMADHLAARGFEIVRKD